jgi:hypothetical protein
MDGAKKLLLFSVVYQVIALAVSSGLCLWCLLNLSNGATNIEPGQHLRPAWVVDQASWAMVCLFGLCVSAGLGILLTAVSSVWLVLSSRAPAPFSEGYAENIKLK